MKKLSMKILCFMLTLSMAFSAGAPAFAVAAHNYSSTGIPVENDEDIKAARASYEALTPEAKAIFEASLAQDPDMLQFHTTYVDPNFTLPEPEPQTKTRSAMSLSSVPAAADPMAVLGKQLDLLSLSSSLIYSFKALGASMAAAIADGPLPFGEILLAATTVGTAAVIAANWNEVVTKWDGIVNAFKKAFSSAASDVIKAFQSLKDNVRKSDKVQWGVDSNKRNHILQGTNGSHRNGWRKFGIDPDNPNSFAKLLPFLKEAVDKGKETVSNVPEGKLLQYTYYIKSKAFDLWVAVFEYPDGRRVLSDAAEEIAK